MPVENNLEQCSSSRAWEKTRRVEWNRWVNSSCWIDSDFMVFCVCKHVRVRATLQHRTGWSNPPKCGEAGYFCSKKKTVLSCITQRTTVLLCVFAAAFFLPPLIIQSLCAFLPVCACRQALILKCSCVLPCVYLLWIWADSEQLHANEWPQLAVIVGAGAMEAVR